MPKLSLLDHLNRLRVEYAVQCMKESPDLSINAIVEESGFFGRSTFYRSFAKKFDMSPAQYRDIFPYFCPLIEMWRLNGR
ncbi:helix-turn-helix domain-containing protein [Parabacteroides sp.]